MLDIQEKEFEKVQHQAVVLLKSSVILMLKGSVNLLLANHWMFVSVCVLSSSLQL